MNKALYLGLEISKQWVEAHPNQEFIHCPIISIEEFPLHPPSMANAFAEIPHYNFILLTSKVAVTLFFKALSHFGYTNQNLMDKMIIAVGKATAEAIEMHGIQANYIASNESSEGIVELLNTLNLENGRFFWPSSALSRKIIPSYLKSRTITLHQVALYTTVTRNCKEEILTILPMVNELIFTSPSTVDAFLELFGDIPWDRTIASIGPVTEAHLQQIKKTCQIQSH
jgi:uroporphyrinogen-III synthase